MLLKTREITYLSYQRDKSGTAGTLQQARSVRTQACPHKHACAHTRTGSHTHRRTAGLTQPSLQHPAPSLHPQQLLAPFDLLSQAWDSTSHFSQPTVHFCTLSVQDPGAPGRGKEDLENPALLSSSCHEPSGFLFSTFLTQSWKSAELLTSL